MSEKKQPFCEFDPQKLILRMRITIEGSVERIDPVVTEVMSVAEKMGCGSGRELDIETALREALANAVVHGCKKDPRKTIEICVSCDESRGMLIVVRDPGDGFDPAEIPSPIVGQNVYSDHGRGIFMINQLVDEVHFDHGGTEIRMRVGSESDQPPKA